MSATTNTTRGTCKGLTLKGAPCAAMYVVEDGFCVAHSELQSLRDQVSAARDELNEARDDLGRTRREAARLKEEADEIIGSRVEILAKVVRLLDADKPASAAIMLELARELRLGRDAEAERAEVSR